MSGSYYLTTAIDYPVGRPHLGNAFEKIGADVQARYRRMHGHPTRLLLGADEHTVLVPRFAARAGQPTDAFVAGQVAQLRDAWASLDITLDDFIRTSDPRHGRGLRLFMQRLYDAGFLDQRQHESVYCENCEEFKTPEELRDGCCANHPNVRVITVREENWFFHLSAFRDPLLDLYRKRPGFVEPDRVRADIVERLERGLGDIAVTREDRGWGYAAPFDERQTIYVWVDALTSYLTSAGYGTDDAAFRRWWPPSLQVIGDDIAQFHGILWPALLMAGGLDLPRRIQVHGLMLHEGKKMSKTTGNVVDAQELADRYGVDALRFFLLLECPFNSGGDFSLDRFREVYQRQLVGKLGALFEAALSRPPGVGGAPAAPAVSGATDRPALIRALHEHMDRCDYDLALAEIIKRVVDPAVASLGATGEPRATPPGEESRAHRAGDLAESLRVVAILLKPFLPTTAARIYGTVSPGEPFASVRWEDAARPARVTTLHGPEPTSDAGGAPRPLFAPIAEG